MKTVVVCILDGLGIGRKTQGNPLRETPTPTFDWMKAHFPYFGLQASGIAVGLPWGEVGSSEIGHLTLGTGRIVYQNYPKITMAVRDGSFGKNAVLGQVFAHATKHNGAVHLVGMISRAKTNAALEHLGALLDAARAAGVAKVLVHAITDGQDALPQEGKDAVLEAHGLCAASGIAAIASVSGRYYAMDTNAYWDRTQRFVGMLLGAGKTVSSFDDAFSVAYKRGMSDALIEPQRISDQGNAARSAGIQDNDAVVFFNFREDGLSQAARSLCDPQFSFFERVLPSNVAYAGLVQYGSIPEQNVLFPRETIAHSLCQELSERGMRILKLTESMKEDLLTYQFNGLRAEPFANEHRIIVPSEKRIQAQGIALQGETVLTRLFQALDERVYHCIAVNFPQLDVAGHQTDYEKGKQAVIYVDGLMNRLAKATLDLDMTLLVVSDHGNIEQMFDPASGMPDTHHNDNPVPFFLVGKQWYQEKTEAQVLRNEREVNGSLADIAPTVLDLLAVPVPSAMTGQSLARISTPNP